MELGVSKIVYWATTPKGGHFAAWEQPNLFAANFGMFCPDALAEADRSKMFEFKLRRERSTGGPRPLVMSAIDRRAMSTKPTGTD